MAHAIVFDTLAYAKRLIEVGVPVKQAEVQAETFAEIIEERLAPKQDLKEMEMRLDLKLQEMKTDIIKWVAAMLVAQAAIVATLVKLL